MRAEFNKTEARLLNSDLSTLQEANDAMVKAVGTLKTAEASGVRAKFLIGASADRILSNGSDVSGKTLAVSFGVVPSTITYGARLARLARIDAGMVEADEIDPKDMTALKDLETFYNFAHVPGRSGMAGNFHTVLARFVADDGEHRAEAIGVLQETFGSTNGAYAVFTAGKNQRFHEDDPRSQSDDGESGGDDQDDQDREDEISWQTLLAEAIDRAYRQGAGHEDVAAESMRLVGQRFC